MCGRFNPVPSHQTWYPTQICVVVFQTVDHPHIVLQCVGTMDLTEIVWLWSNVNRAGKVGWKTFEKEKHSDWGLKL